ncbi:hypothetical protein [Nocardia niigatensis]
MTRRHHPLRTGWLTAVGLLMAALLPACTAHTSTPTPAYAWPDTFQFNFRWSASPGVDLTSGPAIIVRAYLESGSFTDAARPQSADKYYYPGFTKIRLPNHAGEGGFGGTADPGRTIRGTYYWHVLSVKPVKDLRINAEETATGWETSVCTWMNGLTIDYGTGTYDSSENTSLYPVLLTVTIYPETPGNPLPPAADGSGPARYPTKDVFTGWKVFGIDGTGEEYPGRPDQTCNNLPDNPVPPEILALNNPPTWSHLTYTHPLPVRDPYPGWPAA